MITHTQSAPPGTIGIKRQRQKRTFAFAGVLLFLVAAFSIGCKKDNFNGATTGICPIVISTTPINGAINVPTVQQLTATFNEEMDASTINTATFTVRQGTTPVAGTVSYSGVTATFVPAQPLLASAVYTATISMAVRDPAGSSPIADYVWSFNTGSTPTVVSTDPLNGAVEVPIAKIITATFSTTMDATTINATSFTVRKGATLIPGTVTYSGMTATFTPTAPLPVSSVLTATIAANVKDIAGNAMTTPYTWSFATGALPVVVSTDPAAGATGVALNKVITAQFSKSMTATTINATTFLLKQGTTAIPGTVAYSGGTASFTPASALLPNTLYTATITTGVRDSSGNAMAANYTWSFTTLVPPVLLVPPTVIATDPSNNATNVAVTKTLTATFSTAMNPSTINTNSFLLRQGATPIAGVVTYSGVMASFNPTANLLPGTTYTATITTAAQNVAGTALASNYTWSFTTAVGVPPSLLLTAAQFGVFGGSAGITNQGINTVVNNGSIGTTAASTLITGFHDGTTNDVYTETPLNVGLVTGRIHTAPPFPGSAASFAIATQGLADANAAYLAISPASKPGGIDPGAGELGNLTLTPGVYKSAAGTFKITNGNLTLDAQGNPNAEWFFQAPTSLTVGVAGPAGARSVTLINGAQAKNVYWYVGTAATINGAGGGTMVGTIISSAGVTFSTAGNNVQTVLNGRAISLNASVTVVNTTINVQ